MELYVARHGETVSNMEKRLTGRKNDSYLTEKGIKQAKQLGKSLEHVTFDLVYSSPLQRAVDTVKAAFGNKYKICIDSRLEEIGFGVMEGMRYDDVSIKFPMAGMLFWSDPVSYKPPPGGETISDIIKRINSFLSDISEMGYSKIFVLTHGYAMRILYSCTVEKSSISAIAQSPLYANCDVARYMCISGKWELIQAGV